MLRDYFSVYPFEPVVDVAGGCNGELLFRSVITLSFPMKGNGGVIGEQNGEVSYLKLRLIGTDAS